MERGQGFTRVTVDDPWNPGAVLATYVLVPRGQELPAELPQGTLVRTPLEHALVYSSVHTGVMKELGAFAAVRGVVDAQYFNDSTVARGIAAGVITDCGLLHFYKSSIAYWGMRKMCFPKGFKKDKL